MSVSLPPDSDAPAASDTSFFDQTPKGTTPKGTPEKTACVRADAWIDRRLPFLRPFRTHFDSYPMPPVNWLWSLGACLMAGLCLLVASGLFLALFYTPDAGPHGAFAALDALKRRVPCGWLLQGLHAGGASMLFAALYIHVGRGLWYGSYKAPRELVWLSGLTLLLLFMTTAFAGYVLPWGQMSYWGATVITNAVESVPYIGKPLMVYLLGGEGLGTIALHRFFVLHIALGFFAFVLVTLHILCLHGVGTSNPTLGGPRPVKATRPFAPYYTAKDGLAVCVFLFLYAVLVFFLPGWIENALNILPADPLHTPPDITPEWYLAPYFAMLRAIPSRLGGLIVAAGSLAVLFALPWLDRSKLHNATWRPLLRFGWPLWFAAFLTLTAAGLHTPTPLWVGLSRGALVVWFIVPCLLMPLAARRERAHAQLQTSKTGEKT